MSIMKITLNLTFDSLSTLDFLALPLPVPIIVFGTGFEAEEGTLPPLRMLYSTVRVMVRQLRLVLNYSSVYLMLYSTVKVMVQVRW